MLILILNYLPLILIALGVVLVILRPVALKAASPGALGRKQLWFWQAVGFWAVVIALFMIGEKFIPHAGDDDDDKPAAARGR